jgi:hypothetical protein
MMDSTKNKTEGNRFLDLLRDLRHESFKPDIADRVIKGYSNALFSIVNSEQKKRAAERKPTYGDQYMLEIPDYLSPQDHLDALEVINNFFPGSDELHSNTEQIHLFAEIFKDHPTYNQHTYGAAPIKLDLAFSIRYSRVFHDKRKNAQFHFDTKHCWQKPIETIAVPSIVAAKPEFNQTSSKPKHTSKSTTPAANSTVQSGKSPLPKGWPDSCNYCGVGKQRRYGHETKDCPFKDHPDANPNPETPFYKSEKSQLWIEKYPNNPQLRAYLHVDGSDYKPTVAYPFPTRSDTSNVNDINSGKQSAKEPKKGIRTAKVSILTFVLLNTSLC